MTEVFDKDKLIELVIQKHVEFLKKFNNEYLELENRQNALRNELNKLKQEKIEYEKKLMIFSEKYHICYHQAKKLRKESFDSNKIEDLEDKIQISNNIQEEEKMVEKIIDLLNDSFEKSIYDSIVGKLKEGLSIHKELLTIKSLPKNYSKSIEKIEKELIKNEKRSDWLKNRIESHNNAHEYWKKKGMG